MTIKKRIENLEKRQRPAAFACPIHFCEVEEGQSDARTRENWPQCAAMNDEKHEAYTALLAGQPKDKIATVVICLPRSRNPIGEIRQ